VGDQAQVEELIASTVRGLARIEVLVSVGGAGRTKLFLNTTLEQWEHLLRVNLPGCFLHSQPAARSYDRVGRWKDHQERFAIRAQCGGTGRAA
jgi:NAD(P)-dependent dehydrogenase (short-subunit alcohol dehydrogenase family)